MEIERFMKEIHLPEQGKLFVSTFVLPEEDYKKLKELFYNREEAFFQIIIKQSEKEKWLLYLYVRFAVDLYSKYTEMGISDKIYYDTFLILQFGFSIV